MHTPHESCSKLLCFGCRGKVREAGLQPAPFHCKHPFQQEINCNAVRSHYHNRARLFRQRTIATCPSLMIWQYEAPCSVFADLLWERWRDVPSWSAWDPDIESSSLQVRLFFVASAAGCVSHVCAVRCAAHARAAQEGATFQAGASGIISIQGKDYVSLLGAALGARHLTLLARSPL